MNDICPDPEQIRFEGRCYNMCKANNNEMSPCVCANAQLRPFMCPDNTSCRPGAIGDPCERPSSEFLTMCNGIPSNCMLCLNRKCMTCQNGFYFEAGECKRCSEYSEHSCFCGGVFTNNCQTCNALNTATCKTCINQHYLSHGYCFKCPGPSIKHKCICGCGEMYEGLNCRECADQHLPACKNCFDGYYLSESKTCITCGDPSQASSCYCGGSTQSSCLTCHSDGSVKCSSCHQGYFLSSDECIECAPGCAKCTSLDECEICEYNYALKRQNKASFCEKCPINMMINVTTKECVCNKGYVFLAKCQSLYAVWLFSGLAALIITALIASWVVETVRYCRKSK